MITVGAYAGRKVAVFGLARSGLATARALREGNAHVIAWDDNPDRRAAAKAEGFEVADLAAIDWKDIAAFVPSPGVPLTHPAPHPFVTIAKQNGIPVIGDAELFELARPQLPAHRVVAITGTNGKSTTTALIGHIIKAAGLPVAVGGNIGRPILDLEPLPEGGVYVFELSSYQIDLTETFRADVAVLLNLTPDHLDRHGDMAGYARAKERLFTRQGGGDVAVIGVDDDHGRRFAASLKGPKVVAISSERAVGHGVSAADGTLIDATAGTPLPIGGLDGAQALRGQHNWQNAAAAYAAARALGIASDAIFAALLSFPGLDHRLQRVGAVGGIEFINDSKATNIDAASKALATFPRIHWIAGGKPKSEDLSPLAPWFPAIRRAYLIGDAAQAFARSLDGKVDHVIAGDMETATRMAYRDAAEAGEPAVVLLSPACASFDQFEDFEHRGRVFAEISRRIIAEEEGRA